MSMFFLDIPIYRAYLVNIYDVDNKKYRNKKRTMFINPGSVGQPRNHNPRAQFVLWDTETDEF